MHVQRRSYQHGNRERTRGTLTQRGDIEWRMQYIEEQPVSPTRSATSEIQNVSQVHAQCELRRQRCPDRSPPHSTPVYRRSAIHRTVLSPTEETVPTIVSVKGIPAIRSSSHFEQPSVSSKHIEIKPCSRDDDIEYDRYNQKICDINSATPNNTGGLTDREQELMFPLRGDDSEEERQAKRQDPQRECMWIQHKVSHDVPGWRIEHIRGEARTDSESIHLRNQFREAIRHMIESGIGND